MIKFALASMMVLVGGSVCAQTISKPQPYVIDATNKLIGPLAQQGSVLLQTNTANNLVAVPIAPTGFLNVDNVQYYYTTPDCTGTKYLRADSVPPSGIIRQMGSLLVYPDIDNLSTQMIQSFYIFKCTKSQTLTLTVGPAKSLSLTNRNYIPPFKAVLQ